jgi:hypothetical protein
MVDTHPNRDKSRFTYSAEGGNGTGWLIGAVITALLLIGIVAWFGSFQSTGPSGIETTSPATEEMAPAIPGTGPAVPAVPEEAPVEPVPEGEPAT